ncbi:MAG: molybdopterin molybdotransferase MoeA [Rhodobacter sp.]|nr:molybdopterin molybdotransferase MoeA [Rhodobacter sp.]
MITVDEALRHVFALAGPMPSETVPLADAAGRVLLTTATARRDQPPFPASAMDGYAVRNGDVHPGASLTVIGEASAGHRFDGTVREGQAVRIFTGAPVPNGTDRIVIQEDVTRNGTQITIGETLDPSLYVRPLGGDFKEGTELPAPRRLRAVDLALLAAMNVPEVSVARRPVVALIATGDELVMPGEVPSPDQIIASNSFGLKAMCEAEGAEVRLLPIARDNAASLRTGFGLAADADLIVTIGGASVGDHDLVAPVAGSLGMERSFYRIAMRPGKPLMAGRLAGAAMLGLPGNPVSSMVCGKIFVLPLIQAMLGLGAHPAPRLSAPLAVDVAANGSREHYMRATLGSKGLIPFDRQDSSLLSVLGAADALLVRPPGDGPRKAGDMAAYIPL